MQAVHADNFILNFKCFYLDVDMVIFNEMKKTKLKFNHKMSMCITQCTLEHILTQRSWQGIDCTTLGGARGTIYGIACKYIFV